MMAGIIFLTHVFLTNPAVRNSTGMSIQDVYAQIPITAASLIRNNEWFSKDQPVDVNQIYDRPSFAPDVVAENLPDEYVNPKFTGKERTGYGPTGDPYEKPDNLGIPFDELEPISSRNDCFAT